MDIPVTQLPPGDPRLVEAIVGQLKSKGIFDQFRKECLADVDTKPAFQNLRLRVEGQVNKFLEKKIWKNDMNKNQLRDGVRKHVNSLGILDSGIDAIITQVVNPKIKPLILPFVEDTVYAFLQIDKPKRGRKESELEINPLPPRESEDDKEKPQVEEKKIKVEEHQETKPALLPMETDVISSEEDDILARESPDGDKKSVSSESDVAIDENARDGFETCPQFDEQECSDEITADVERLNLSEDDSKSAQATKPPLPLFDDQSLDSISSNSSGLTFSPLTDKGSPESKKSLENTPKSEDSSKADARSATSTPLVDEKPVDELSQSSLYSDHSKEFQLSEKGQGDQEAMTPTYAAMTPSSRSAKDGASVASMEDEDSSESKDSSSKTSRVSEKYEGEEKAKSEKSEGEITSSSSELSDTDGKSKQETSNSDEKNFSDHDSSHKSSRSKSDHKRRDSYSRERDHDREKDRDSRHHREKERKHSKSRDDHHSHRDKDKKYHRRDKDHDGDKDRSRVHHHQSSSSHKESSGSNRTSGDRDKDRSNHSSHHSSGKSSESKSRSKQSSEKTEGKSSSKSITKSEDKTEGKSHKRDEYKHDRKHHGSSDRKSDSKSEGKRDKRSEDKADKKSEQHAEKKENHDGKVSKPNEGKYESKSKKKYEDTNYKSDEKSHRSSKDSSSSRHKRTESGSHEGESKKHKHSHRRKSNSEKRENLEEEKKKAENNNTITDSIENVDDSHADGNSAIDPQALGFSSDNIIVADDEGNIMLLTYDTDTDSASIPSLDVSGNGNSSSSELFTDDKEDDFHGFDLNDFEGFVDSRIDGRLANYLRTSTQVPDEMDIECSGWFSEADLHLRVSEDTLAGKIPLDDFLKFMQQLGAVIKNEEGEIEDHSAKRIMSTVVTEVKDENIAHRVGKRRRISNSSSVSSSGSSTDSPRHKRFRKESLVTNDTAHMLEQDSVIVSGYALLTPEDDGNRSMSREYGE
ncbi:hypothetical protein SK128_021504 [Halocaridina rubra]|uniref:BOD1/SHG1 domain-containing protein n=1 Tax=Halocaridina rubra TaxID=373956 RepID=A0AAN9A5D1_HALRR